MIVAPLILAAALSAGNAEFDRAAAEGAALITLDRAKKDLVENGPVAGALAKAMLSEPTKYRGREEAFEACKDLFFADATEAYRAKSESVRKSLNLPDSFEVAFTEEERQGVEKLYPARFDQERRVAVAEQAKTIVSETRPSEEELETKDEGDLIRTMVDRVDKEQGERVFEENRDYISEKIVKPIIEGGKAERKRQIEFLKSESSTRVAPSALSADMLAKLKANVAERCQRVEPSKAWGVFPSVAGEVLERVVRNRTIVRYVTKIDAVHFDVTAEEVLKVVSSDPAAHVMASDSERLFATHYSELAIAEAKSAALSEAPEDEREELKEFIEANEKANACKAAVDRMLKREIVPKWRQARQEASAAQFSEYWPELDKRTWYPNAELADKTCLRPDYVEAVRHWRKLDGLSALASAGEGRFVMEETSLKADKSVATAFDLARSAIAAQNSIVDEMHAEVLKAATDKKNSLLSRAPDLKAIVQMLTDATMRGWDDRREGVLWPKGDLPENAGEQHRELFPSVIKKIELVAKSILEEVNAEQKPEEEKKPEEPPPEPEEKPEEPPPEETPPEEPPPEIMEFSISITKEGDEVEIKVGKGDTTVDSRRVPAKRSEFEKAMKGVSNTLGGLLFQ